MMERHTKSLLTLNEVSCGIGSGLGRGLNRSWYSVLSRKETEGAETLRSSAMAGGWEHPLEGREGRPLAPFQVTPTMS